MKPFWIKPKGQALIWLAILGAVGFVLVMLYPDGYQQDSGFHYLYARWAWRHPEFFVGVWQRPLYAFIYSFPAMLGYQAARSFTVILCVAIAWQTWSLAEDLDLIRSWLVIPLLLFQPAFFTLLPDLMTEPVFALVFVIALRLHLRGDLRLGMLVASLLILARPEGFFMGLLWAVWILFDKRTGATLKKRLFWLPLLAVGAIIWWSTAYLISGDPLYILHNWPKDWSRGSYGSAHLWSYPALLPEIVGPIIIVPFLAGLIILLKNGSYSVLTSSFLVLFLLHSLMWISGQFGEPGYPRFMVCVAPTIAIISTVGWSEVERRLRNYSLSIRRSLGGTALILSSILCFLYFDSLPYTRDGWAIKDMYRWFRKNERPVTELYWSHPFMGIVFDTDIEDSLSSHNQETNQRKLGGAPPGTLIFWDNEFGPNWYRLTETDLTKLGYTKINSRSYILNGYFSPLEPSSARYLVLQLFYKD